MSANRYVQHISGQGKKFKLHATEGESYCDNWRIDCDQHRLNLLPRSEYIPCDPPTEWKDVTAECEFDGKFFKHQRNGHITVVLGPGCGFMPGYRISKVQLPVQQGFFAYKQWAFIIEKEEG